MRDVRCHVSPENPRRADARQPTGRELRNAQERFRDLLQRDSSEADFQRLFTSAPYVLSNSLPLRLQPGDIRPLARPGRSEPDFEIVPRDPRSLSYGVIELKRPDSRILVEPRRGTLILSHAARTAISQAEVYGDALGRRMGLGQQGLLVLGTPLHMFVIMGLSAELSERAGQEIFERQLRGLLPAGCSLVPYDVLLALFEATIPTNRFFLTLPESLPFLQSKHVIIVGASGSGKSVIGKRVAELLGCDMLDTDEEVATASGHTSVRELLTSEGLSAFREQERLLVKRLGHETRRLVVVTGGGLPSIPGIMDDLNAMGLTVYLRAKVETLWERLSISPDIGTHADTNSLDYLRSLVNDREQYYRSSSVTVDTDELFVEEVINLITELTRDAAQ